MMGQGLKGVFLVARLFPNGEHTHRLPISIAKGISFQIDVPRSVSAPTSLRLVSPALADSSPLPLITPSIPPPSRPLASAS